MVTLNRVLNTAKKRGGFLTETDVKLIAEQDRLRMLLVRLGNGRFLAPAQDVKWLTDIITEHGKDYVRDVSLPSNDKSWYEKV